MTDVYLINNNISDYKCFEELNELFNSFIHYHFKILFEMHYFRVYNDYILLLIIVRLGYQIFSILPKKRKNCIIKVFSNC